VFTLAALIAFSGGVRVLAQTTSFLLLVVFLAVHVSLLLVKWRESAPPPDAFAVPSVIPAAGVAACIWMLLQYPADVYARGAAVFVAAVALYAVTRRRAART